MRLTASSREPVRAAVLRRLRTVPLLIVLLVVVTPLLPVLLLLTLLGDVTRFVTSRATENGLQPPKGACDEGDVESGEGVSEVGRWANGH